MFKKVCIICSLFIILFNFYPNKKVHRYKVEYAELGCEDQNILLKIEFVKFLDINKIHIYIENVSYTLVGELIVVSENGIEQKIERQETLRYGIRIYGMYYVFSYEDYEQLFINKVDGEYFGTIFHTMFFGNIDEMYDDIIVEKKGNIYKFYTTFNEKKLAFTVKFKE